MEGNASVYEVYPVSRITGEGRAEVLREWGPGFEQEGAGGVGVGGVGTGGAGQFVRGNYKFFEGINLMVLERTHQFIMGGGRGGRGSSILCVETIHPYNILFIIMLCLT